MNQLGKTCTACNRERSKTKSIMYDSQTLMPYCEHPYICNTKHPNSPVNLIERGEELKLININDAQKLFKQHLIESVGDPKKIERIRNLVDKPTTIRVGSPDLAQFLLKLEEEYNFSSLADTIRFCIQMQMENQGAYYRDFKKLETAKQVEQQEQEAIEYVAAEPKPEPKPKPQTVPADDELDFEL
jgi:hypothetical protein